MNDLMQTILDIANTQLLTISGTPVYVSSVVTFVVILLITYVVSHVLRGILERALLRSGVEPGTTATLRRFAHYLMMLLGLAIALDTIGISLTSVFAAGAFLAVGIGFAIRQILENFASGIIILGERSIQEGDILEVEGELMKVERIGTRATVTRTRDDDQRIIPNTVLVQGVVKNYTLGDPIYRIRSKVGVSYDSDMALVERALLEAAESIENRYKAKDPVVLLLDFGDSSVVWEVSIWAEDPWLMPVNRSHLNKAVWWTLKKHGITIAYPQLDLHVKELPTEA